MQSLKQNKILLGLLAISLIAFSFYHFSGSQDAIVIDPLLVGNSVVEDKVTADILILLNQMQQASIDGELFTSTAWTSLVDQSIVLPSDTPGRPDLFTGSLQSAQVVSAFGTTTRR
jgi:hypothetical protein